MPIRIEEVDYFSTADVAAALGISRVTLWRWRHDRKIPQGHRLRGRQVIFTTAELEAIRKFALRVEPITEEAAEQLALFGAHRR